MYEKPSRNFFLTGSVILLTLTTFFIPSIGAKGRNVTAIECNSNSLEELKETNCTEDYFKRLNCCPSETQLGKCSNYGPMQSPCIVDSAPEVSQIDKVCEEDREIKGQHACKLKTNPHEKVTIWDKASRAAFAPKLNKTCNTELYNRRMLPIWRTYLQCPENKNDTEIKLQEIIYDYNNYNRKLLDELCFSELIEQCVDGYCECFQEVFGNMIIGTTGLTFEVSLNFTQFREGKRCGLLAGSPCTHNIKDLSAGIVEFPNCKDSKYIPVTGSPVPFPFDCEKDAACAVDFNTKQCLEDKCFCVCATDHQCVGSEGRTVAGSLGMAIFLAGISVVFEALL